MDDPDIDPTEHARALVALGRIHRLSRSARLLLEPLRRLADGGRLRVLDLASGGGDLLIALAAAARRAGLDCEWSGCDRSTFAVERATALAARGDVAVRWFQFDVFADAEPPAGPYDVVMSSFFLHHLSNSAAETLLRRMATWGARGGIIHDLRRTRAGFGLAWLAAHVLTRSPVVRYDALASVEGAFALDEVRTLADRARLPGVRLQQAFPERFVLEWSR